MPSHHELPYRLHTNRELGMMLRGEKPLAVFVDGYDRFPAAVRRYLACFDQLVREGLFLKREYVVPDSTISGGCKGWHTIIYSLPAEAWRIDAMIDLRWRLSDGWSLDREREEGRLLGYEDWQNEAWLERFSRKGP